MNASQKVFNRTPPIKGSFPLDHDGECKEFMQRFIACLKANKSSNIDCRQESREYLSCRMEKGLMSVEDFRKLGFKETERVSGVTGDGA